MPAIETVRLNIPYLMAALVCVLILLRLPVQNEYLKRAFMEKFHSVSELELPVPAPYPLNFTGVPAPDLTAEAVMVTDIASGKILLARNPDKQMYPASTTKIMTALVVLDYYNLDQILTVGDVAVEGQKMDLVPGENMSVENLLYGLLVHSANDAALVLADNYSGGRSAFVDKMNAQAQQLGLTHTHFTNPVGLDNPVHYTTANDLLRLSLMALKNPLIMKITGVMQITVADADFKHFHALKNVNQLLGKVPGVSGFKTGYTENAGQALITSAVRDHHRILILVLKSQDRFAESEQLVNWVFDNFRWQTFSPPEKQ